MMATLKDVSQSIRKGDWAATRTLTFRCLLQGSQKVHQVHQFSVPSAPIQFCSSDLRDDQPASCGYVQGEGDSIDSLFGQFPGVGSELGAVDFSHQYSLRHFRPGWIQAKL